MDLILNQLIFGNRQRGNNVSNTIYAYSSFAIGYQAMIDTYFAIPYLYTEVIGVDIGIISFWLGAGDAFSVLLATGIGFASDNCMSPWGQRKPFIATGSLFMVLGLCVLANPPNTTGKSVDYGRSKDHALFEACPVSSNCTIVRQCIIERLTTAPSSFDAQTSHVTTSGSKSSLHIVWFALSAFVYKTGSPLAFTRSHHTRPWGRKS